MEREAPEQFILRKEAHISLALRPESEVGTAGFERISLVHSALPEINLSDVTIETVLFNQTAKTPFYINSMTAGHTKGVHLNLLLATAADKMGWSMGVGSQRRELYDDSIADEWREIRKKAPSLKLFSNIGLAQARECSATQLERLINNLEASALIIHLNPLQEAIQIEGTPYFSDGLKTLERVSKAIRVPVIVKETGCGFSPRDLERLKETGIAVVDVSGFGGTHWGRIEGFRAHEAGDHPKAQMQSKLAQTFADWGNSTVDTLVAAQSFQKNYEIWASGGIRNGLDAAKSIALGASYVGFARPLLVGAMQGEQKLIETMKLIEEELKLALFCTGSKNLLDLRDGTKWRFHK